MQPLSSTLGIAQPATASALSAAAKAPTPAEPVDRYERSVEALTTPGQKAGFLARNAGLGAAAGGVGFPLLTIFWSYGDVFASGPVLLAGLAAAGAIVGGFTGVALAADALGDAAVASRRKAKDAKVQAGGAAG